jgi:DNA-binding beta-propeller fold protein YncE
VHLYVPEKNRYQRILGTSAERLRSPISAVFDDELRLYVSDSSAGAVFVFNDRGEALQVLGEAGDTPLLRPTGLAYAGMSKVLYVADTTAHVVYALDKNLKLLFRFGGRGVEKGTFNFPTHLHTAENGAVHVTDSMNFRIQSFDGSGGFISSFGRHGDGSGDFSMPKGITVDREGVLYVVDTLFDNVQLFNEKGDFLLTVGKQGSSDGEFWLPSGIFLDEQDKLYVCDTYNQRIQVFQIMRERHE